MPKREDSPTVRRIRLVVFCLTHAGALFLASGSGPELVNSVLVVALWTLVGLYFLINYLEFGICCFSDQGDQRSKSKAEEWRAERGRWWLLRRILLFGSIAALFWSGRPFLAGLWLSVFCFWLASVTAYRQIEATENLEEYSTPTETADVGSLPSELIDLSEMLRDGAIITFQLGMILAWIVLLIPVVVTTIPLILLLLPFAFVMVVVDEMRQWWTARDFKNAEGRPDGMIYFVYAEPHQHTRFLERPGVLAPFGTTVIARNWRTDIWLSRSNFNSTSEAKLLQRFGISNLKTHLPFIAIIGRRGRVKSFNCNEAYRARIRDGGSALANLEDEIRAVAERAFPR